MTRRSRPRRLALLAVLVLLLGGAAAWRADLFAPAGPDPATVAGPPVMRRLTQPQYRHIIADLFGPDIAIGGRFDPDERAGGLLQVGASRVSIPASGMAQYAQMARSVAAQVLDARHRATYMPCTPADAKAPDDACARAFLAGTGRLLWRRPLDAAELEGLVAAAAEAARTLGDFHAGLEVTLVSLLESPRFLFVWETGDGQGRLDAFSRASRLSFLLWNTTPDDALLRAAETGALDSDKGLAAQVDRLLASPKLEQGVRVFFQDMLGLDGFQTLAKDQALYPRFNTRLAAEAQEQTLRTVVDHLLTRGGDYRDLFTTRRTFLTRQLGALAGVPVPGDLAAGTPDGWQPYEYPAGDPRAGLLAQPGFLALHSHPGRTSPTLRGKALREMLLCQKVPDPPANVNFNIVQDTSNPNYRTVRQRLLAHANDATCVGCHKVTDPIGLALENFDTIGGFRTEENGAAIDASGTLDGADFADPAGLARAMHDNPATPACLVERLQAYALGRTPTRAEREWAAARLQRAFASDGYRLVPLLRRIALSPEMVRTTPPDPAPPPATQSAALPTGDQP
jgi:hypothetical protein